MDSAAQKRKPRLGLFLNMPMHEVDGEYTARYPHLFDFFLLLASRTERTALCLPLKRGGARNPAYGTVDLPANVEIVGLGHWSSGVMLLKRAPLILPFTVVQILRRIRRWDTVGAVAPGLVGNLFIALARRFRRPAFLLVRGEKQRTMSMMLSRGARAYVWGLKQSERPVRRWVRDGIAVFTAGDEMRARYAQPGSHVHDLYPGLARDFPLAERPRPAGGPGEPLRVVTVTRLSGEKGTDVLIDALRHTREPVRAVIVGDGPERAALQARAEGLAVEFAGFVPHGPELIARLDAADLFVLASRSEGMPHSLIEAAARALPAVVSAVGGMPSLIERGGGGVVVPVGEPEALAAVLDELARDRERLARLSAEALETGRSFAPEAQLEAFCERLEAAYPGRGWGAA